MKYKVGDLFALKDEKDNSYKEVLVITEQFEGWFKVYEPNTNKHKGIAKSYLVRYYEKVC